MVPIDSKKARTLGIRLVRRWLSITFTAPKTAVLNSAVLIQFNKVSTHFQCDIRS